MFRQATIDDLREIATWIQSRQDCVLWAGPYQPYPLDPDYLPADLELFTTESLVLLKNERLIAFGQLQEKDTRNGHLARLIVYPGERRRGHGRTLVKRLLQLAIRKGYHSVSLNVDRDNHAAQTLYAGLGFTHSQRPDGEYASPQSQYMTLKLS